MNQPVGLWIRLPDYGLGRQLVSQRMPCVEVGVGRASDRTCSMLDQCQELTNTSDIEFKPYSRSYDDSS